MKKIIYCFFLEFLVFSVTCVASPHTTNSINESWKFSKGDFQNAYNKDFDDSLWGNITIPHTWNKADAIDEIPGFYRGTGWYRRSITIPADKKDKQLFIQFDGVNQECELFINGQSVGLHSGGYTAFIFDITKYVKFSEKNLFAIKVSNKHNENIPPLSGDFTFFGGIYRDVNLIFTDKQHISTTYYASSGIFIKTPIVTKEEATVQIRTLVSNDATTTQNLRIENTILSPKSELVLVKSTNAKVAALSTFPIEHSNLKIIRPMLWSPDSPSLYKVITRIYNAKTNELLDEKINPLGLRWFKFTADEGFFLNGKQVKLIGTNRHQTYLNLGNALSDEIHINDVKLLKEMGGNFLRVSHYPQDHVIMEMCDKLGIICSVEIPIVNAITENETFTSNCLNMTREMVMQDFNRPSVFIWAYMNEVLLVRRFKKDSVRNEEYSKNMRLLASKIEKQIREDDPSRYTMIPEHGEMKAYINAGLAAIPMIVGFNLYSGWYGNGTFQGFDNFLDNAKQKIPGKPFIITEYGADVDPRLHSFEPQRFDYTQEYANLYHEHYIKTIFSKPWVAGATIWNLNDFYSEERGYAVPHVNLKGIVSLNREKKDTYLQYQAALLKEPVVLIGGMNWKTRGGIADSTGVCTQPVKVYTNQKNVELFMNGKSIGKQAVIDNIAQFYVPFSNGNIILDAVSAENNSVRDQLKLDFHSVPLNLNNQSQPFTEINVMLGSKRYFEDKTNSVIWIPEKEYTNGSWGYIGGKPFTKRTKYGTQPASELDILGTDNNPIFQTARTGIETFKLDVPNGKYTVCLYLAELQSSTKEQSLVYNLGNVALKEDFVNRIFDVDINGKNVLKELNLSEEFGVQQAIIKKFEIDVTESEGISINFRKVSGEPLLNAIRVYKNY